MIADDSKKRKLDETEDERLSAVKLLKAEISKAAPQSLALPAQFRTITGPGHTIACNRPFEADTVPLVLLEEAFAIFKRRCDRAPSDEGLACLGALTPLACQWHDLETQRREEVRSILREYLNLRFDEQKVAGTEFTTDGNISVVVMPAAIRGCNNEHGGALNEAIGYYGRFLSNALEDRARYYNSKTRFPSILLVDIGMSLYPRSIPLLLTMCLGSYMGFYGALWDDQRVRVVPLTPLFDLTAHWLDRKARRAVASSLDALVTAVNHIEAHYKSIEADTKAQPTRSERYDPLLQKARFYPYKTSFKHDGKETNFTYDECIDSKLTFFVTTEQSGPGECVFKFAWQYSEAAHKCLTSLSSSPMLYECVQISADWTAVVMQRSEFKVLYGYSLTAEQQEEVRCRVVKVVKALHEEGFVHGGIRDTNILVDPETLGSDNVAIHIIHLDWAGQIGKARYPLGVNTTSVKRPRGVQVGELITPQHDLDMVSYLFQ
jgi:hypothetical protein